MKYEHPKANEWILPVRRDYRLGCCDCGLVHRVDFRVVKRRVQIRFRRDNRATAQMRRHLRKTGDAPTEPK